MSLKIGEVSKLFDISTETLRFYESEKIIEPKRDSDSNYRIYSTWDILHLMECIKYRNLGMSLKDIANLIHCENINFFIDHLRKQDNALLDNIRYEQLLHSHISEYIDTLDTAPFNLGNFWFRKLPDQYCYTFLTSHNDDYEDISAENRIFSSWSSNLHLLDMALHIPRKYIISSIKPENESWSYVIKRDYAEILDLPMDKTITKLPSAMNLCTIADMGEKGNLDFTMLKNVFDYIKKHNLTIKGDLLGKVFIRFHERNTYHRYMEIQIPVSRNINE